MIDKITLPEENYNVPDYDEKLANKTNEIVDEVNDNNNNLINLISNIDGIVESDFTVDNGFVRFKDGFQIAWKNVNDTGLGELWQNFYISDTTMGNWKKPFTVLFASFDSANLPQYWTAKGSQTAISAGVVRLFRPNSHGTDKKASIIGIGRWK